MRQLLSAAVLLPPAMMLVQPAPLAWADSAVAYEVVSADIPTAAIEYADMTGRKVIENVTLPWRAEQTVPDARGEGARGAQVRADWRPLAWPSKWVTVRIYHGGQILCQNTMDVGNATCYGSTPHVT